MCPVPEPIIKDKRMKKTQQKPSVFQRLILLGFTRGATRELMAGDCEAAIYSYA